MTAHKLTTEGRKNGQGIMCGSLVGQGTYGGIRSQEYMYVLCYNRIMDNDGISGAHTIKITISIYLMLKCDNKIRFLSNMFLFMYNNTCNNISLSHSHYHYNSHNH